MGLLSAILVRIGLSRNYTLEVPAPSQVPESAVERARRRAVEDFRAGHTHNPYFKDTDEHTAWAKAWEDARRQFDNAW